MELTEAMEGFILHWGEMGPRWGVNRTTAQILALLYVAPQPMCAGDIGKTLCVSRSNVSQGLRELQAWGIVRIAHVMGDRRSYFESLPDVWEMFTIILDQRKKRECDPTLAVLRCCLSKANRNNAKDSRTFERLSNMLDFFSTISARYAEVRSMSSDSLARMMKKNDKPRKVIGAA